MFSVFCLFVLPGRKIIIGGDFNFEMRDMEDKMLQRMLKLGWTAAPPDAVSPLLPDDNPESLAVDVAKGTITASTTSGLYPLVGAVFMMVPLIYPCDKSRADAVLSFLKGLLTDHKSFSQLVLSGFAEVSWSRKLQIFRAAMNAVGQTCSSVKYVRAGGSSAIESVAASWVLEYLLQKNVFFDYTPDGSGSGLTGIKQRTHRFAGSDALFSAKDRGLSWCKSPARDRVQHQHHPQRARHLGHCAAAVSQHQRGGRLRCAAHHRQLHQLRQQPWPAWRAACT